MNIRVLASILLHRMGVLRMVFRQRMGRVQDICLGRGERGAWGMNGMPIDFGCSVMWHRVSMREMCEDGNDDDGDK
jgi:hypothetical protein